MCGGGGGGWGREVESCFLEPSREMKIGLRNQEVQETEGKISETFIQGRHKLVRKIKGLGNLDFALYFLVI